VPSSLPGRHDFLDIPAAFATTERPMTEAERSALRFLASGNPWKMLATVAAILCGINAIAQVVVYAIQGAEQLPPGTMSRLAGAALMATFATALFAVAWLLPDIRNPHARHDLQAGRVQVVELQVRNLSEMVYGDDPNPSHAAADVGQGWLFVMELGSWLSDVASCETESAWPKKDRFAEGMTLVRAPRSGYVIGMYSSGKLHSHVGHIPVTAPMTVLPQCIFLQATIETLPAAVERWIETLPKRRK